MIKFFLFKTFNSVLNKIKIRFNWIFANKSYLITKFMKHAIEEHERRERRLHAIDGLLKLRKKYAKGSRPISLAKINAARTQGRS
jgi:hypothetical protein